MKKDAIKTKIKQLEEMVRPPRRKPILRPRTFIYFEDSTSQAQDVEGEGTVIEADEQGKPVKAGQKMSLEKWQARRPRVGDSEMLIRFVDEQPITTITTGDYQKTVGIDASKL